MSQLIFADCIWVINLIAENNKWDFGQVFHREKGIEFGLGFNQAVMVFGINEEDDARDFWEVVLPETASCRKLVADSGCFAELITLLMSTKIKGCELYISNSKLF